ncbi:hypothetical protein D3C73_574000 [compost metagenome]
MFTTSFEWSIVPPLVGVSKTTTSLSPAPTVGLPSPFVAYTLATFGATATPKLPVTANACGASTAWLVASEMPFAAAMLIMSPTTIVGFVPSVIVKCLLLSLHARVAPVPRLWRLLTVTFVKSREPALVGVSKMI